MNLDTDTKVLRIVLGEVKVTNDCDITTAWGDCGASSFMFGNTNIHSNGTTVVTVVAAPVFSVQRQVKEVRLFNNDTVSHTVTLQLFDGANAWVVGPSATLVAPGGSFVYTPEAGVQTNTTSYFGALGVVINTGTVEINNTVTMTGTAAGTLTIAPGSGTSSVILTMPTAGGTVHAHGTPAFKGQEFNLSVVNGATLGALDLNTGFAFGTTFPTYTPSATLVTDNIRCFTADGTNFRILDISAGFTV